MTTSSISAYETHASSYLQARDNSAIGVEIVKSWAQSLAPHTETLEIGCGGGLPVTRGLVEARLKVWAVDSSPTLLSQFKSRFPKIPTDCANALDSTYFGRSFDAAAAIGLLFLLDEDSQAALLHRVSEVLAPGGRFLFTAPTETGTWADITTGHECRSPGRKVYEAMLADAAFRVVATYKDEGGNHYFDVSRIGQQ